MPEICRTALICPGIRTEINCNVAITAGSPIKCMLYSSNILHRRLVPYAEKILGDYQCGFRKGQSTTDNIIMLR